MKTFVQDITVLNKFTIGSNHWTVRVKISINSKRGRRKLIRKDLEKKLVATQNICEYRRHLEANLTALEKSKTIWTSKKQKNSNGYKRSRK